MQLIKLSIFLLFPLMSIANVDGFQCYSCINDFKENNDACLKRDFNNIEIVECQPHEACAIASGLYKNIPSVWMGCKERTICDTKQVEILNLHCSTCYTNLCNKFNKTINKYDNEVIYYKPKTSVKIIEKPLECYHCSNLEQTNKDTKCKNGLIKDMTITKCNQTQSCGVIDLGVNGFARGCGDRSVCSIPTVLECTFCDTHLCNGIKDGIVPKSSDDTNNSSCKNSLVTLLFSLSLIILKFVS